MGDPTFRGFRSEEEARAVRELIRAGIEGRLTRRGLMRRAAALGLGAPAIAALLQATGGHALAAPGSGAANRHARLQETIPAEAPTAPEGCEPQEGGTVTVGTIEEPDTLNPYITQLVTSDNVLAGVMEGLLEYDSEQQLVPALAESYEVSEDGLTYTFHLRPGVTFHNGEEFDAQDVIDTYEMIMNPEFGAFSQLGWDKIVDISAPDPLTVVMQTEEPFAPFLSYVGTEYISPSEELAKGPEAFKQEFGRQPIGTGPMQVVEWQPKQQVVLEKFADYWGGEPKLDSVIYRVLPDDNTLMVQLRTGEVDLSVDVSASRVDEALGFDGISVLEHPTLGWKHLDLKHIDFLREPEVRQALDFATPSQQIIEQLLKGRALPSVADQAPGTAFFNPNIEPRPYDPERAKELLAEAGFELNEEGVLERDGQPFEIELWGIAGESQDQQIIQAIAQSWNAIGVKTEPKFQDVSTIWGPEGYQFTDKMTAALYSWYNSNDPDDMFYWHSSQIPETPTGTGGNLPAYFHEYNFQEEIDRLTEAGARETDPEKRKEIYWEIQELLHEQVPVIFIYWNKAFPVVANNIGGFWPSAFNGLLWNVEDWYLCA